MDETTTVMQDTPESATLNVENSTTEVAAEQDSVDIENLKVELEKARKVAEIAEKKRLEAEKAIEATKRENSKLKKATQTDAEQLAEQQKELEEKARQYDIQRNSLSAEKILVGANLDKDDYEEALGLIVSEDAERTEAIAQWMVDILGKQTKLAAKTEREKVLKETPRPPTGGTEETDPFVVGFTKG